MLRQLRRALPVSATIGRAVVPFSSTHQVSFQKRAISAGPRGQVLEGLSQYIKQDQLEMATQELKMLHQMNELSDRIVTLNGREFMLKTGVYASDIFGCTDSALLACEALGLFGKGKFLDMGSGCGAIAVFAALSGCSVAAVDISPHAIENTLYNAEKHGVKLTAKVSDLFSACEGEAYDVIFWNYPGGFMWFSGDPNLLPPNHEVVADPGHVLLRRFLTDALKHLKPGGRIITAYESFGDEEAFQAILEDLGLAAKRVFTREDGNLHFTFKMSFYEYGWLRPAGDHN